MIKLKDILTEQEESNVGDLRPFIGDDYDVVIKNDLLIIPKLNKMIDLGNSNMIPQGKGKMSIGLNSEIFPYLKDYNIYLGDKISLGSMVDDESKVENHISNNNDINVTIDIGDDTYIYFKNKQGKYLTRYFIVYNR